MNKILVVGAGFAGCTFARLAAEDGNYVEIIDKRDHIGGNCYSYQDEETGIEIHKYGPHIFHTNDEEIYEFIDRFANLNNYVNRVKAIYKGQVYSLPINLHTINQFFKTSNNPIEAQKFIETKSSNLKEVSNFEEYILNSIGMELYEAFFKFYTIKQWGIEPARIPVSTAKRLPIRYIYNDNYFDDKYQGIPNKGYGKLFENLTDHNNISITLNLKYEDLKDSVLSMFDYIVYTGSIDRFYNYSFGRLPYRTVEFERIDGREIQGCAVINYTDMSVPYTRIHEHKYFTPNKKFEHSIAFKEFSKFAYEKDNLCYPIINNYSMSVYHKYFQKSNNKTNLIFLGRLAKFKYLNMDEVIKNSIEAYHRIKKDCLI